MKFCPYCGGSLPGGAASFCPECGKSLPLKKTAVPPQQKKRPPQRSPKQTPQRRPKPKPNPMDVNYDGYYDDVQPIDSDARGEGMDPELLKRIGLVILGAVGAIVLAVILMTLL